MATSTTVDNDTPSSLIRRLEAIDPKSEDTVIIAGGPPCHDHSRIRAEAPGVSGEEGAKFIRFSEFVKELEKTWNYPQAILVVECVVPVNKQDVRLFEQKLSAQAVVSDSSDLGVIARPRSRSSATACQKAGLRCCRIISVTKL